MPTKTLECGCTLDTDFVQEEHLADGPPYHISKGGAQTWTAAKKSDGEESPEAPAEEEAKPFWKGKKK